jgi:hypothetical protein
VRTKLYSENLKGREQLDDLGMDGRIQVRCISGVGCEGVDLIHHLAHDGDWWRAFVNTVMNLWVP